MPYQPRKLKTAIQHAYRNVATFHQAVLTAPPQVGIRYSMVCVEPHYQPINRVGLYVPGGSALVSTVLMLAIPAKLPNAIVFTTDLLMKSFTPPHRVSWEHRVPWVARRRLLLRRTVLSQYRRLIKSLAEATLGDRAKHVSMDFRGAAIDDACRPVRSVGHR